jgi:hypothetical protein
MYAKITNKAVHKANTPVEAGDSKRNNPKILLGIEITITRRGPHLFFLSTPIKATIFNKAGTTAATIAVVYSTINVIRKSGSEYHIIIEATSPMMVIASRINRIL